MTNSRAKAASAAAVVAGHPGFETIPLLRVRENSQPGSATLTDTQADAIGEWLAIDKPANVCWWFQVDADEGLLGGLERVADAYEANL